MVELARNDVSASVGCIGGRTITDSSCGGRVEEFLRGHRPRSGNVLTAKSLVLHADEDFEYDAREEEDHKDQGQSDELGLLVTTAEWSQSGDINPVDAESQWQNKNCDDVRIQSLLFRVTFDEWKEQIEENNQLRETSEEDFEPTKIVYKAADYFDNHCQEREEKREGMPILERFIVNVTIFSDVNIKR